MNQKEKLIEIINNVISCDKCGIVPERMAEDLIFYGVTVQKWISVDDRLPEDPLQTVLVTNGKEICVAVYSVVYDEFGVMCGRGQDKRFGVTHWMPLPQPPKGG